MTRKTCTDSFSKICEYQILTIDLCNSKVLSLKDFKKIDDHQIATLILTCAFPNCFLISFKKCLNCQSMNEGYMQRRLESKMACFAEVKTFVPSLESVITHMALYIQTTVPLVFSQLVVKLHKQAHCQGLSIHTK